MVAMDPGWPRGVAVLAPHAVADDVLIGRLADDVLWTAAIIVADLAALAFAERGAAADDDEEHDADDEHEHEQEDEWWCHGPRVPGAGTFTRVPAHPARWCQRPDSRARAWCARYRSAAGQAMR
jgi:hypothetical protein